MKFHTEHTFLFKALMLCGACATPYLFAQESNSTATQIELDPITIMGQNAVGTPGQNQGYVATATNTATGMNLSFKNTPQSTSSTTSQRIQDGGLTNIDAVAKNATGLTVSHSDANRVQFWGRGLPVKTMIHNGTPITWDVRFAYGDKMLDTSIYERVEIVRGANGLMQGAGSPAAAINMVNKRPTYEFAGEVSAGLGNFGKKAGSIDISSPLTNTGNIRARGIYSYQGGGDWQDRADNDQNTLYGILEADVTPNTLLTVGGMFQNKDADASMSGGLPLFYSDGSRTDYQRKVSTAPSWATYNSRIYNGFASVEHHFNDDWRLKASYDYHDASMKQPTLWATGNPDPITNKGMKAGSLYFIDGERQQNTFDLTLNGQFELFGREHEVVAGAQHWKQTFKNPYYGAKAPLGLPYAGRNLNPANPPLGDFTHADFNYPATQGYPSQPSWDYGEVAIGGIMNLEGETSQTSGYLASKWQLTDELNVLVGGRLDHWKTNQTNFGTKSDFSVDSQFTPYLGVTYDINDQFTLYGNYTSIFTPQSQLDKTGAVLKPIVGNNYETGVKASLFDNSLNASLSAFEIRQNNVAVADGVIAGTKQTAYRGQDGTKTRGLEAEVNGAVTPEWNLYAGYTRAVTKDPDGKQLYTTSPKNTFKLFTTYDMSAMVKGLTVGGGVYWQSGVYREGVNNPVKGKVTVKQDGYATVDLMARYNINDNASVSLNVNNVFDKKYYTQLGQYDQYFYGAPRNVMLNFKYSF